MKLVMGNHLASNPELTPSLNSQTHAQKLGSVTFKLGREFYDNQ